MEACIFDLDGTIVTSHPTHFAAYEKLFADFGIRWSFREFNDLFAGTGAPAIIDQILKRHGFHGFDLASLVHKKRDIFNRLLQKKSLMTVPGFHHFLRKLKRQGVPLAIASGSNRANIRAMLENIGVSEDFPHAISGEDVTRPKPAPDIFLAAAEMLEVVPSVCVVFEDTEHGVAAAKTAGMRCIGLATTIPRALLEKAGADEIVENYIDLRL